MSVFILNYIRWLEPNPPIRVRSQFLWSRFPMMRTHHPAVGAGRAPQTCTGPTFLADSLCKPTIWSVTTHEGRYTRRGRRCGVALKISHATDVVTGSRCTRYPR